VMQLSSVVRDCRSAANRPSGVLPADDYDAARGECPVELCGRDCASTNGARAPTLDSMKSAAINQPAPNAVATPN